MRIVFIGAGPGGYVGAARAAKLGAEVVLVEKQFLGGTCLNWGCIPTKALLHGAKGVLDLSKIAEYGVAVSSFDVDTAKMVARKNEVVEKLRSGVAQLMKMNKVKVVEGFGSIEGPGRVEVDGPEAQTIEADAIVVATGSEVLELPGLEFSKAGVISSDDAVDLPSIPKTQIVIGAGAVGVEFATIFSALGTKVTVVEMLPSVLPVLDPRLGRTLQRYMGARGIEFKLGTKIETVNPVEGGVEVTFEGGELLSAEQVLVGVGRKPALEGLGLDEAGVEYGRRGIAVNEYFETNVKGIYAIGDAIGGVMLAHVASAEAIAAVENAMGARRTVDYETVPSCIYTVPEVAAVGVTAAKAEEMGISAEVGRYSFLAVGKALAEGEADGYVEVLAEAGGGKVLGANIIGPHATEIIHEIALAIRVGAKVDDVAWLAHAHPSVSEAVMEAAQSLVGGGH
ncbi:MAG: dihydrolipoyl dehydrogenase [Actinobacteria bacterium]|nr:MAG: dihydrolipoyl dehydrogenase [Actinomycetota bacterium]